ncbi:MAG TPA: hypothetical protein PK184_04770 [Phycisphaerae bacterium]|nr:hypothetical protein [Phycisphaerae bacterium]
MRRGQSVAHWSAICIGFGWCALGALAATPAEELDRARGLFDKGQYVEAREVLQTIDREQLDEQQKGRRDELLKELEVAINQANRARQNLEDADQALKTNDASRAERLYRAVQSNDYATSQQKARAREGLALLERQRRLQRELGERPTTRPAATRPANGDARAAVEMPLLEEALPQAGTPAPAVDPRSPQAQRARATAAGLIREGNEAMDRAQYDVAAERYQAALRLVPNHPEALEGLALIEQRRGVENRPPGIESVQQARRVRWQRAEALLRAAEQDVRAHLNAQRFDQAQARLNEARQTLEAYRRDAEPADRYAYWNSQLSSLGRRIELERQEFAEEQARIQTREAREAEMRRFLQDQKDRNERIAQLMEQAVQFQKERQYEKAIDVLNEVLLIDPLYDRAEFMKRVIEDANVIAQTKESHRRLRNKFQEFQLEAADELAPVTVGRGQLLRYPEESEWRMIARRDPFGAGVSGESEVDRVARQKLATVLPVVELADGTTLADAIEFLQLQGKIAINVNWGALMLINVERTTDIGGVNLRDVKIETVLDLILDNASQAGGAIGRAAYDVIDGVVRISTQDDLNTRTVVRVYDIRDLLVRIRSFRAPDTDNNFGGAGMMGMGMMGGGMMGGVMGGGMMGGMMGGGYGGVYGGGRSDDDDDDESEEARQEVVDEMIDLIMNNIEPGTWAPEGELGSVDVWNDRLIVRHTASVHRQIVDLLRQLRASKDLQVAVETRFITLQSNFMEEIGIDLDIVLNQGNAGLDPALAADPLTGVSTIVRDPTTGVTMLQPRRFTQLGFTPAAPGFGQPLTQVITLDQPYQNVALVPPGNPGNWWSRHTTPVPIVNNSLALTQQLAQNYTTNVPGTIGASAPAFQVFGSFLDNIQVDFLMRATQMDARSSIVDAPRLVVFNGRQAFIAVQTLVSFVISPGSLPASGSGVGGQAAAGVPPTLATLNRGRTLEITPYVSADRKYVTMEIHPEFNDVRTSPFVTANGTIQVPEYDQTEVRTYGTVPDGGTLLVGGLKQAGEVEVEAGVPVISKLPGLKRFFTNRQRKKDERILLMLIKPKIIIQEEQEQEAFPSLTVSGQAGG